MDSGAYLFCPSPLFSPFRCDFLTPHAHSNGEFEMTTTSPSNSFVQNSALHIVPTLTADTIPGGNASVFDGYMYNATGCTSTTNFEGEGTCSLHSLFLSCPFFSRLFLRVSNSALAPLF